MAEKEIESDDLLYFLKASLFGSEYAEKVISDNGKKELAINRAYRDMNRTLETREHQEIWEKRKGTVRDGLKGLIIEDIINTINNQTSFDEWHGKLCGVVTSGNHYTFGQAQKWVNMTLKYLIVLDYKPVIKLIPFLHVPIDEIIVKRAKNKLGINIKLSDYIPWSKKLNYETDGNYSIFQKEIREKVKNSYPIQWEFKAWNSGG